MHMRFAGLALVAAALGLGAAAPASSQEWAQEWTQGWKFTVTPYLWLPTLKGDIAAVPGRPPQNVNIDVADALDGAFMMKGEARHDRLFILGDVDYLSLSGTRGIVINGTLPISASMDASTLDGTIAGGYRAYQNGMFIVDLLGGVRYTSVDLGVDAQLGSLAFSGDKDKDWWDPIVGGRVTVDLGGGHSLRAYGDVGGFGLSSDLVWQVFAGYAYQFNDLFSASIGYRHYSVDFSDDDFSFDVELGGLIAGLGFTF